MSFDPPVKVTPAELQEKIALAIKEIIQDHTDRGELQAGVTHVGIKFWQSAESRPREGFSIEIEGIFARVLTIKNKEDSDE